MRDDRIFGGSAADFRYGNLPFSLEKGLSSQQVSQTDPIREMAKRTKAPFYLSECYAKSEIGIEVLQMLKQAFALLRP